MPAQPNDVALLGCVLLNLAAFGSAWRFCSRRVTTSATQALLDAALLGFTIQYAAVGLAGAVGLLRYSVTTASALVLSAALAVAAGRGRPTRDQTPPRERAIVVALGTFAAVVAVGFATFQFDLPVMANDALTYHFPAAAQWIQQGRIAPFPTWFFNPANGYSPLAGSTFVAWLMLPFGSDVLARYVQVPALLGVGLGVYRLGRALSADHAVAAALAVAAVLCRPLFMAELMGKDDLFVAFAFVAALVAMSPARSEEPFAAARLGIAVGMLLALKYTVLLVAPMLLLAVDGFRQGRAVSARGGRSPRLAQPAPDATGSCLARNAGHGPARPGSVPRWITVAVAATVLAGPWYLRNWLANGNPLFPLDVTVLGLHLFHGLFTSARSIAFTSPIADARIVLGGSYGVPIVTGLLALAAWATAAAMHAKRWLRDPILRACVVGPPVALALFFWRSPFPEVRFILPAALLLIATAAVVTPRARWIVAALPIASVATLSIAGGWVFFGPLVLVAGLIAVTVAWVDALVRIGPAYRRWIAIAVPLCAIVGYAYVRWDAASARYGHDWAAEGGGWSMSYRDDQPLWSAVARLVPADATVAYADLYLVYPLQGATLGRRVEYAPTRAGVYTPADLTWIGNGLSGEQLVRATDAATVADPDPIVWRENLRRLGAQYLVIGHVVPGHGPVELDWARGDGRRFKLLYDGPGGQLFAVGPAN